MKKRLHTWRGDPLFDAVVLLDAATGQPEPLDPSDTVTCQVGTRTVHVATATTTIADQEVSPGLVQHTAPGTAVAQIAHIPRLLLQCA